MRILHLLGAWPPEYGGGVTETTFEIARAQAMDQHDVFALVGTRKGISEYQTVSATEQGITVIRFGYPASFEEDPEGWWLPRRETIAHEAKVADLVSRVLHESRAEILDYHVNRILGEEGLFQVARMGVPIVASLHDFWLICGRLMLLRAPAGEPCSGGSTLKCALCLRSGYGSLAMFETGKALLRLAARRPSPLRKIRRRQATLPLVRAAMARSRYLAKAHAPFIRGSCEPILPGIEHDGVMRRSPRGFGVPRFGFFAGAQGGKGLEDVLMAARELRMRERKFELVVFGGLPKRDDGLCEMRPAFVRGDREAVYSSIDMAIVATRHVEPRGRVPEEAALFGCPSIVPNIGGLPETIRDQESGLLYEFRNPMDLMRQMERVILEKPLMERLRQGVTLPPNLLQALPAIERTYREAIREVGGASGPVEAPRSHPV